MAETAIVFYQFAAVGGLFGAAHRELVLVLSRDGGEVGEPQTRRVSVAPYRVETFLFGLKIPDAPGDYVLTVSMQDGSERVFSEREIPVR